MIAEKNWKDWRWHISNRITDAKGLGKWVNLYENDIEAIRASGLRMAITPYFAHLMDKNDPNCPIRKQAIPSLNESCDDMDALNDPCGEDADTVAPGLVHRYPDRVLMIVTDTCAMYCRHCTRRRIVGEKEVNFSGSYLERAFRYIEKNKEVRDVLISGGDPLMLKDEKLEGILSRLHKIPHIQVIRIGSRVPVVLPQRITDSLVGMLKKFHPIYMNIHFNHPKEITELTKAACGKLADAGIPLGSQTVLLKGINDSSGVMMELMHRLLTIRVKPYYIYQCDLAKGTKHFRTSVSSGIKILESLRGHTSGYAVPTYVIDAPGGGGKVPINPEYIISRSDKEIIIRNWKKEIYIYPESDNIRKKAERIYK